MDLSPFSTFSAACLGIVFMTSAWAKSRDVLAFALSTRTFLGLSLKWARPLAWLVILSEAAVVILMAIGMTRSIGLAFSAILLTGFTIVLARAIRHKLSISCQCFGRSSTPVRRHHLARNALLLGVAIVGLLGQSNSEPRSIGSSLAAIILGVVIGIVITLWDDLAEIIAPSKPSPSASRSHLRSSP